MLAYLRLLVKDRLVALRPVAGRRAGHSKAKAVGTFVAFTLLALMLYAMVVALEYFVFQAFVAMGQPEGFLGLVVLVCVLVTLLLGFFHVVSVLFFARDMAFVSALPLTSRQICAVKLCMVALQEAGIALLSCLPAVILYGIHTGAGALLYVKLLLLVPLVPLLPLAVVTTLAFLLIRVSALWKRREGVTTVVSFLLMIGIVAWQMSFSTSMGEEEHLQQLVLQLLLRQKTMIDALVRLFPPVGWLSNALLQPGLQGLGQGLLFVGSSIGVSAFLLWLLGGRYQALALRQSEALARLNAKGQKKKKMAGQRSPFMALYLRELREIFTVPVYATNCLSPLVMFPVMLVAVLMGARQYIPEMATLQALVGLIPRDLAFAVLAAFLCLTGSMNMGVSTAVSREGKRYDFHKILPVAPHTQLLAKLWMGWTLAMLAEVLTAAVVCVLLPTLWVETLCGLAFAALYGMLVCLLGLLTDVYHPKVGWKSETEAVKQNINAMLSMLWGFLLLAVLVGGYFGFRALGLSSNGTNLLLFVLLLMGTGVSVKHLVGKASVRYNMWEVG